MTDQNEIFRFFAQYIEKELGIIYADHNSYQLQTRLEEVAKNLGFEKGIIQLYEEAKRGIPGRMKSLLLDTSTNNETSFFRDEKVFKALAVIFKGLDGENVSPIRIWSAASSTGQEPLSTAIVLEEIGKELKKELFYTITATDISSRVLEIAKKGSYSKLEVFRGLKEEYLNEYFSPVENDRYQAKSEILNKISYQAQNLKEKFLFSSSFDVILCRNVLIYQSVEGKKEILSRLEEELKPGGYLILGSGESLIGLSDSFEQNMMEGAVVYRKKR